MISRTALVLAVAFVFYFLLPEVSALLQRLLSARRLSKLKQKALSSGVRAVVSGVSGESLLIKSCTSGGFVSVSLAATAFFAADRGGIRKIPRRHLLSVPKGLSAIYIPPASLASPLKSRAPLCFMGKKLSFPALKKARGACIFFDSAAYNFSSVLDAPEKGKSLFQPFSIAIGAFAEFCLFLEFLGEREQATAAFVALAAVFGKGAPYIPPGLFLTLAGISLASKRPSAKPAAFALKACGVAFNAMLFFVLEALFY